MVMPCPEEVSRQQEILYRIEVLESCQLFVKTTPLTAEPKALYWHYLMVDAYFRNLRTERCLAVHANEDVQKRRDTALGNLDRVIQDYQNRFKSFAPSGDADHYRKKITGVIQTVLSVWVQYRQTFIEISKEAA
jgi:hypothetical protein